ncbi:MAG: hypothetical protein OEU36_21395 [Gammaproteobacteria bacterium]|nr:hypothetical protein [Gammaproteobacteria bacterium]
MPHITLEYSSNITQTVNFEDLFSDFHRTLAEVGGVRINNCKSRGIRRDVFLVGEGDPKAAFVHVDVLLVEGRSQQWMQRVGQPMLQSVEQAFEESKRNLQLQITVHFRDLKRERYFKYPSGTLTPVEELDAVAKG